MSKNKNIHIKSLTLKNYLKIEFLKIEAGKLVHITGDNEEGKTSIIKAINEVFNPTGKDDRLSIIHNENNKAEVFIELDNGIQIERSITGDSSNLKVTDDGVSLTSPKAFIDKFVGYNPFNPVAFVSADKKTRRQIILEASPFVLSVKSLLEIFDELDDVKLIELVVDLKKFDYSQHGLVVLEDIKQYVYDKRKEQNVHVVRLQKTIEQEIREIPDTFDADRFKGFKQSDKLKEYQEAVNVVQDHNVNTVKLKSLQDKHVSIKQKISDMKEEIERLEFENKEIIKEGEILAETVKSFVVPDVDKLKLDLDDYDQSRKIILKIEGIEKHQNEFDAEKEIHSELDALHKLLANEVPKIALSKMNLPVKGIQIEGDDILIDGYNIDTLSTKRQIELSVEIAKQLSGSLKLICIDRFESFSPTNQKVFLDSCSGDEFQLFITLVTDGPLQVESDHKVKL